MHAFHIRVAEGFAILECEIIIIRDAHMSDSAHVSTDPPVKLVVSCHLIHGHRCAHGLPTWDQRQHTTSRLFDASLCAQVLRQNDGENLGLSTHFQKASFVQVADQQA